MKTPREILLEQHRSAAPKLDAIRQEVVAELNNQDAKAQSRAADFVSSCLGCSNKLWLELVWPCRRIWTGLAAVWILLFIVNFSQRDTVSSVRGKSVRSGEVMMSLQAQQRWMNELLADRSAPLESDRLRKIAPKPRSETDETVNV
jgi:hypothetical protein